MFEIKENYRQQQHQQFSISRATCDEIKKDDYASKVLDNRNFVN